MLHPGSWWYSGRIIYDAQKHFILCLLLSFKKQTKNLKKLKLCCVLRLLIVKVSANSSCNLLVQIEGNLYNEQTKGGPGRRRVKWFCFDLCHCALAPPMGSGGLLWPWGVIKRPPSSPALVKRLNVCRTCLTFVYPCSSTNNQRGWHIDAQRLAYCST